MNAHIVVGIGFGDEGKGLTTSSLVSSLNKPVVIRFNGGHQAGHTVVDEYTGGEEIRHVILVLAHFVLPLLYGVAFVHLIL